MIEVRRTEQFSEWLERVRDRQAQARIARRIQRIAEGHLGDWKHVGEGVSEFRIDYGPGYRIYFTRRGATILILLGGGDKSSQNRDILSAKARLADLGSAR